MAAEAMDPRVRARRIEVARSHGRRRFRRLMALTMVTVLVLGALALSRSPLLDVDSVTVAGADRSGAAAVRTAAGIDRHQAMTSIDLDATRARIDRLPWVQRASVSRHWPGTVRLAVVERTPVAIAGEGSGAVLIDQGGHILGPVTAADRSLPLAGPDPTNGPGGRIAPAQRPVVAVLADLPTGLRHQVARATSGPAGLGLVLRDGIRIHLGDATRLGAKSEAVAVLLDRERRPSIATIDVAVPGAPALTRRSRAPAPPAGVTDEPLTAGKAGGA